MGYPSDVLRRYLKRRYAVQRRFFLQILGDKCSRCGSRDGLQIDHREPSLKSFSLSKLFTKNTIMAALVELTEKCQALCGPCHRRKSAEEARGRPRYFRHGTLYAWMKARCTCTTCSGAKREWLDRRNAARRASSESAQRLASKAS